VLTGKVDLPDGKTIKLVTYNVNIAGIFSYILKNMRKITMCKLGKISAFIACNGKAEPWPNVDVRAGVYLKLAKQ
jgi:hypothetical protein